MDRKAVRSMIARARDLVNEQSVLPNPDYDEPLRLLLQVVEAAPDETEAYKQIAQIFLQKKDKKQYFHYLKLYQDLSAGKKPPEAPRVEAKAPPSREKLPISPDGKPPGASPAEVKVAPSRENLPAQQSLPGAAGKSSELSEVEKQALELFGEESEE